jgi:hypothetical protein
LKTAVEPFYTDSKWNFSVFRSENLYRNSNEQNISIIWISLKWWTYMACRLAENRKFYKVKKEQNTFSMLLQNQTEVVFY